MAGASSLLLLVISHLSLLSWAEDVTGFNPKCPSLPCGNLGNISFPFSNRTYPECGLLMVDGCSKLYPQKIQLGKDGPSFYISDIRQDNSLVLRDHTDLDHRNFDECGLFQNFTPSSSPFYSFELLSKSNMFKCNSTHYSNRWNFKLLCNDSNHSIIYYNQTTHDVSPTPAGCSVIQSQVTKTPKHVVFRNIYTGWLHFQVNVTEECYDSYWRGGQCQSDSNGKFQCSGSKTGIKVTAVCV